MQQFSRSKAGSSSEAPRLSVFNPDPNGDALPVERPATAGAGKRKPRAKTLWQRSDGRWCRKIGRTFHYFGKDKDAALDEWLKRKTIRKAKAASNAGARMFTVAEARSIVKAADDTMKAMILLGLNCAFGQSDISALPKSALDLTKGWVNFPRVKTAAPRNIPLWPETVAAVKRAIVGRPAPADPGNEGLVFITKYGNPWTPVGPKGGPIDSVGLEFSKLLTELKIKRPGLNFYALRHTFSTVSSDACDQIATNAIMGHLSESDEVPGRYREFVAEERLRKVTEFVRVWLFPTD